MGQGQPMKESAVNTAAHRIVIEGPFTVAIVSSRTMHNRMDGDGFRSGGRTEGAINKL